MTSGEIFIAHGDITQLTAHTIVCTTSQEMRGTGKMHPAFRQHVPGFAEGFDVLREQHVGSLRPRGSRLPEIGTTFWLETTGGGMPHGVVVVIATGMESETRDGEAAARAAVTNAVKEAHSSLAALRVPGPWLIALPAIRFGTGGDRDQRLRSAEVQIEAARNVLHELSGSGPLADLAFIAYRPDDYQIFLEARAGSRAPGPSRTSGRVDESEVSGPLVEALRKGECVLFVGSGLSLGSGLPSWGKLIERLARKLKVPKKERRHDLDYYLDLAQWYTESPEEQKQPLREILAKTFGNTVGRVKPSLAHYLLTSLPVCYVITTNYDDLLERALRALRRYPVEVIHQSHVASTGARDGIYVVKFHGDAAHPKSLVLTRDEYDAFFQNQPAMALLLEGLLLNQTFFFVGYSLRDPDFRQIHSRIAAMLSGAKRTAFATTFEASPYYKQQWAKKQVELIATPDTGAEQARNLVRYLDRLAEAVAGRQHLLLGEERESLTGTDHKPLSGLKEALRVAGKALEAALEMDELLSGQEVEHFEGVLRFLTEHGWRPTGFTPEGESRTVTELWECLAKNTHDPLARRRMLIRALAQTETFTDAERIRKQLASLSPVSR